MEKLYFKDCKISKLRKLFGLKKTRLLPCLTEWLTTSFDLTEIDKIILKRYQEVLLENIDSWNEFELVANFIGPVLSLSNFGKEEFFNSFHERSIAAVVQNIDLQGKVDGMIAAGKEEPEQPYFCLQEYKRETDPDGDPMAQALGAMLVAQQLNENKDEPVYGAYIRGRSWYFLALEKNYFAVSLQYDATKENDLFDIFRILNGLRLMLEEKFKV